MGRGKMIRRTSKRDGKGMKNIGGHEIKWQRNYVTGGRELLQCDGGEERKKKGEEWRQNGQITETGKK
jgi:hypothetical protein